MERELIAATETLKHFWFMLHGQKITIHTDQPKNLTYNKTEHVSPRFHRQRLLMEER